MISKDSIKRTATCYWSDEDECFIVESPLFDRVAGVGDTEDEARESFLGLLDDAYKELKLGNVAGYNKVGRPSKPGVQLNCRIRQDTHNSISLLADALGISQGELIDVMAFHYVKHGEPLTLSASTVAAVVRKVLDERGITGIVAERPQTSYRAGNIRASKKSAKKR